MALDKKLNPKQRLFAKEYLKDLNATQAAIRAGYSKKTAAIQAHDLLRKPNIAAQVQKEMDERSKRTEITIDRVLKELARIAFADPRTVMKWGPDGVRLRDSEELTEDEAATVAEVSQTISDTGGSIKLKMNDKNTALQMAGRHLKMFTDKIAHGGDDDAPPIKYVESKDLSEAVRRMNDGTKKRS